MKRLAQDRYGIVKLLLWALISTLNTSSSALQDEHYEVMTTPITNKLAAATVGSSKSSEKTRKYVRGSRLRDLHDNIRSGEKGVHDESDDGIKSGKIREAFHRNLNGVDEIDPPVSAVRDDDGDWHQFRWSHLQAQGSLGNTQDQIGSTDDSGQRHLRSLGELQAYGIDLTQLNDVDIGSADIPVCLVDTGYALGHPDLPSKGPLVKGFDNPQTEYYKRETWRWDKDIDGHGSHSAGTICGIKDNNIGIAGAGRIPVIITRGLDDNGDGRESDVRSAVEQCKEAGAKVISLSLGGNIVVPYSQQLYKDYYEKEDILFLAAAGNQGDSQILYPASYEHVISVGSVDSWYQHTYFSNYNEHVEIAAPGVGVVSADVSFTAVSDGDKTYPAYPVKGSLTADVEKGQLVYCGLRDLGCEEEKTGMICFMQYDGTGFNDRVKKCIEAGGVGAIIFNNELGPTNNWLSEESLSIPVIGIDQDTGKELYKKVGKKVSIIQQTEEPQFTYSYKTGTSMSTPFVAAAAAKIWSNFPDCTNAEIRKALQVTAMYKSKNYDESANTDEHNSYYGHGILQTKNAFDYLYEHGCAGSKLDGGNKNKGEDIVYSPPVPERGQAESAVQCEDDMAKKFYKDSRGKKMETCKKLQDSKGSNIDKRCSMTSVSPNASEVCPKTCGTCS